MIEVFDKTRRRVAILENAYAASESQKINSVWYFYFSLPYGDSKNEYCKPFYYVRPDGGELYRIMPETLSVSESGGISYQCEHVLATLIDNVLFGYHVVGNLGVYTADVIRYILDHQLVKNWVLDECDFRNQFEYGWEQESLLSALFSVLSPLSSPMIVTDTTVYPWRLSLKKLVTTGRPEMYVRRRYNKGELATLQHPQTHGERGRLPLQAGPNSDPQEKPPPPEKTMHPGPETDRGPPQNSADPGTGNFITVGTAKALCRVEPLR